jgi:hypothetical protein
MQRNLRGQNIFSRNTVDHCLKRLQYYQKQFERLPPEDTIRVINGNFYNSAQKNRTDRFK